MIEQKVWVEKMPESCWECPCFKNDIDFPCGLSDGTQDYFRDEIDGVNCPLQSIKEHDNELDDDSQCVAELKTKLEQAKTKIKEFETENKRLEQIATAWSEESSRKFCIIKNLQQQLERLNHIVDNYKSKTKQLCKDKFTAIENMDNAIRNRDNIAKEFAIENLKKIKDYFVEEDEDGDVDVTKDIFEVVEYINTLITKLKGEV